MPLKRFFQAVLAMVGAGLASQIFANCEKKTEHIPDQFTEVFQVYNRGGAKLTNKDLDTLEKYHLIIMNKHRYNELPNGTWQAIKCRRPNTEIFLYIQGVDSWDSSDHETVRLTNNIGRLTNARGHSMGSLMARQSNPEQTNLILVCDNGNLCLSYPKYKWSKRYLMDFGHKDYHRYWLEAVDADYIQQPWGKGVTGLFIDNAAPGLKIFPSDIPEKYSTTPKWGAAMNEFVQATVVGMARHGWQIATNSGGLANPDALKVMYDLAASDAPPAYAAEEVAFVHGFGKADSTFMSQEKWLRQVQFIQRTGTFKHLLFGSTKLRPGEEGKDNHGAKVTYWDSLVYAWASHHLARQDKPNNAMLTFFSTLDSYTKLNWFDPLFALDLGAARGDAKTQGWGSALLYYRVFDKGLVIVNPSWKSLKFNLTDGYHLLDYSGYPAMVKSPVSHRLEIPAGRARILLAE